MHSNDPASASHDGAVVQPAAGGGRRVAYLLADGGIAFAESRKGGSIHARSMARALERAGSDVDVYVLRKGKSAAPGFSVHQAARGKFTRWWLAKILDGGGWRWLAPWHKRSAGAPNPLTAIGVLLWQYDFLKDVRRQCRLHPPDLFYARHSWLTFPYARLKRSLAAPLALEVNAILSIEKAQRGEMAFAGLTRRIEREAFEAADLILPVSAELRERIIEFGISPEKIMLLPNAVDLELFSPSESEKDKEKEKEKDERFCIGFMHSFKPYHGMEILLEAVETLKDEIPELHVEVVGIGPELDATRRRVEERGLRGIVRLHGLVEHERVASILRGCNAGVAPYHGEQNLYGCPMKLYEYMALQLPIVAARWGDIPNIIEHGKTALLHEPGSAAGLADALRETWRDPEAARARALEAYALAQGQSWDAQARKVLAKMRPLMEQVAARRQKNRPAIVATNDRVFRALQPEAAAAAQAVKRDWVGVRPAYRPQPSGAHRFFFNALLWSAANILESFADRKRRGKIKKPIRVLRITSVLTQGGVAKVVVQSLLAQDPEEAQTTVLTFGKKIAVPRPLRQKEGVRVQVERLDFDMSQMRFRIFSDLSKLAGAIRRERPDIIHLHEPQFAPIVRMASALAGGIPLVVHLHSVYHGRRGEVPGLLQRLERRALERSALIACSQTILDGAREWLGEMRRPIELIDDGADDVILADEPDNLPAELRQAAAGKIVIAKMARLVPLKRIEDFMQACRTLLDEGEPIFILLMAYGKERPAAEFREKFNAGFAASEGEFLFRVPAAARMLASVDIGVSASSLEGLGLNILEYQTAGVPVVCTDLPAHREMVEDGVNGILYPPCDAEALTAHLRRLIHEPAMRIKLAEAGKASAAKRSWADAARKTADFYRRILG